MYKYLHMKIQGLLDLDGPRTPHILLTIVFPIDMFYSVPLPGNLLSYSVLLANKSIFALMKALYLLRKLTIQTHHSYLPFYCNSPEKQFLKEILGGSHCIMIRDKFRTPSHISHGAFVQKQSTAKSRYHFSKNLHHRGLTGF